MGWFDDKVLFVTGGGSGIGEATARRFARNGGRVAVADLELSRAQRVADDLGGLAVSCDVADEASVGAAVAAARDELGRIDCVFNCAGYVRFVPLPELEL